MMTEYQSWLGRKIAGLEYGCGSKGGCVRRVAGHRNVCLGCTVEQNEEFPAEKMVNQENS